MTINWDELKKKANKKAINATLPTKYEKEKAANESITKVVRESNTPIKSGSSTKYKKKDENKASQSSSSSIKNEKKSDTKSSANSLPTKTSRKNGSKANRSSNKRRLTDTQKKYQEEQYKTKAVPQAIARFTEKVINDVALAPASIPYQIATGEKLVDMGLEPTTKSAKTGAKVGSIAGDILSYGTGYKAAEKAVGKAAGKALATKTGKKAVEKAAASKVGKKVGEKTVKKVAESATKGAIADATVGTTLNLSHARGEGLEGEELAKDMALNAALDLGVGGAIEALPIAKALVKNKSGKKALRTIADDASKTAKNASESVEKTVNAELPTKATKEAENAKKSTKEKQKQARKQKQTAAKQKAAESEVLSRELGDYVDNITPTNQKAKVREGSAVSTLKSDPSFNAYMADTHGDIYAIENTAKKSGKTLDEFIAEEYNNYRFAPDDIKANYGQSGMTVGDIDAPTGEISNNERKLFANYLQQKYGALDNAKQAAKRQGMDLQTFFRKEKVEYDRALNNPQGKETLRTVNSKVDTQTANVTPQATKTVSSTTSNVPQKGTKVQTDIPQSLKSQQPEIKVNSKGEEVKVADFDVEGNDVLGIVSPESQTIQEAMENASGFFDRFYKNFVNSQHEIDKLSKAAGDTRASNAVQAARSASGTSEYIYTKGLVNPKGEIIDDRSFYDVFKPISKNSKEFNEYAQHLNNISRWAEGKPLDENITAEQSKQFVNDMLAKHPEFAQMTQNLNSWWQKFTHSWLVDTGRMTENAWQAMTAKYPNYVPAFMPDKGVKIGGSKFAIGAGTKAAKAGNTLKRIPIEDAMMQQVQQMVKTTRKNDLYLNVIDTLRNNPDELKRFGIVSQNKQPMVDIDFDDFMSAAEEQTLREVNSKVYTISAMENGQKVIAYINKDLADAFAKIDNVIGSPAMQDFANIGKKITNPLKAGITGYNPIFAIANASRDIPTALIQSQYGVGRTTKNMVRAIGQMATNGDMWKRYLALGGKTGGYINAHKGFERNLKMSKNPVRNVWEGMKTVLGSFGEATEAIPRFAEFMSSMEKYGDTAKAIADAAEITVNFARAGEVTKTLDAWTLYLNAAVQGIDKFARTMKAHPLRTSARSIGVVGAPYALLMVANWNNPHYQDLNDRTKQNYFCIPNMAGEYDEQGNAKTFIKIPVNREYGTIFASSLDVIGDYITGKADPLNGFSDTVKENFLPPNPLTDNVLAPIYYNLPNNTDFAGRKIVPTNMENLSPELQQDYSTSGLAKGVSKAASNLNIPSDTLRSPKKVDYLIDSFGGYLGQIGQAATDQSIESTGDRVKGATIDPFIDRFSADPRFSSGVVSDFYDDKETAERAYNDIKFTTGDKGQEYVANKVYTAIQSELSDLSKQEKEILSGNLSNSEKDRKIKEIREQRNEIARGADARVEDAIAEYKQNPNYAVLDAQQKESYEKKYKDLGVSKEDYAVAKQIISDTDAGTNVAKAYALLESGQSVDLAIAMTSETAVEEASEYKKNGVTYDEIQKANQIVKDSGYSKSVGKAYALLSNGTSESVATMMTSERAVKNATRCRQAGVTPEVLDKVASYIDTNGNGSYTKDEIMAFFNANGAEFTQAQKAAIFMSLNTSKYNPYY